MTWKYPLAGAMMATAALAFAQPASAKIIKGYTDLYATLMGAGFHQYGDDSQYHESWPCDAVVSGPCAKTRFSFTYDTSKPPYEMRTSLQLLERYYVERPEDTGFPSEVIGGKEYLPLPFYSRGDIAMSYPQLGPVFAPGDGSAPPDYLPADQITSSYALTRFAVGQPGNALRLEFDANREQVGRVRVFSGGRVL